MITSDSIFIECPLALCLQGYVYALPVAMLLSALQKMVSQEMHTDLGSGPHAKVASAAEILDAVPYVCG